ncbi:MAG TPA: CoA pyrophosphatase [Methylomirabilota bacterium]|jgi:8-oxo-dGTP pyrophosphatase MutT (NUDIX family)
MPSRPLDLEGLRRLLDAGLSRRPRVALDRSDLVSAAVLVPVTDHDGPHVLFTKKTASVPHHKGQFSFPGGIVEQRDGSRVETALREAWEEIRLPAAAVEVLGLLDDTETRATNFIITPVVGIVRDRVDFAPDGREIERVLEVPLAKLRDPDIFRTEIWERNGERHPVQFYQVSPDDLVWGATARILTQFLDLLDQPGALAIPPPQTGARGAPRDPGLCAACALARRVVSARGSEFWLCALAARDPAFAKYPRLPVLRCPGYHPGSPEVSA